MSETTFLKRVVLKNYKSIAKCEVKLGPLNYLIGANGAGKSNFLDALRLVTDSLNKSLDHALKERGGVNEVRRRSSGHPTHFSVQLEFSLSEQSSGYYGFRVGAQPKKSFEVQYEECRLYGIGPTTDHFYRVENGVLKESDPAIMPAAFSDRLYLVAASGIPAFRPVYDALAHMGFYNLNPAAIREFQAPDTGELLARDGGNITAVLDVMKREHPELYERAIEFLGVVVRGLSSVEARPVLGQKATLEFRQAVGANESPWRFYSQNMSDGTLRALGVLIALFQGNGDAARRIRLVGIEEPEMALHPGAAGVLRDALFSAAHRTQVLVTTHSPELLDDKDVEVGWILAVKNEQGSTVIGPMTETDKSVVRDRLSTVGELMRSSDVEPAEPQPPEAKGLDLFGALAE
jgi:predicted ATPase